jgi:hypothetical protein
MVHTSVEALLVHGIPSGITMVIGGREMIFSRLKRQVPQLGDYPQDWVRRYAHQCFKIGVSPDEGADAEYKRFRERLAKLKLPDVAHIPTTRELRAERNRQTKAARGEG